MYYGKMTKELEKLYSEYEKKFDCEPDFYEETEYGEDEYDKYVENIKKALELGIELPCIYPEDDDEF